MSETVEKRKLFEQLAVVAKSFGHEYRLELLELVAQCERSVEALTQLTGLPVGTVSQHLQQLRRGGLVVARKEGRFVYYSLAGNEVMSLLESLREVAENNLAEVRRLTEQYYSEQDELDPVSSDELLEKLRAGEVTLLDVRPQDEYMAGHLPGAINIPLDELAQRFQELPNDQEVVAYCRGLYCALSLQAIRYLRQSGLQALRLSEGYPQSGGLGSK